MFGGSAWQAVGDGQFYLHLFAPEQPDFNWANPEVRADFLTTLRFWSDRGVDGFRVDVAHALAKDLTYPLRSHAELAAMQIGAEGSHPLWDREELDEIYAEWRAVFDEYDPPRIAVAEAWVEPARRHRYAAPTSLGQAFNFDLLRADFDADGFRAIIDHNLESVDDHGIVEHVGVLEPRRRAARHALRPARRQRQRRAGRSASGCSAAGSPPRSTPNADCAGPVPPRS